MNGAGQLDVCKKKNQYENVKIILSTQATHKEAEG